MLSKFSVKKTLYNCRCSNCCIDFRGYILYEFGYGFTSQYRFALYSYNDHISWGASPEEVEMIVTKPIEQAVATVNNIKKI